jgi:hypothetical protein
MLGCYVCCLARRDLSVFFTAARLTICVIPPELHPTCTLTVRLPPFATVVLNS